MWGIAWLWLVLRGVFTPHVPHGVVANNNRVPRHSRQPYLASVWSGLGGLVAAGW
ncbi:hypothetical protein AcetOrient_orf01949 [Acetobacter orientalis]|uniref:Uncharacterized protein n=1 Tax=Acetobacter orientalis TaxID=146474 RepID=A0A2Z5ZHJ0_9PROT|nr:hypothetical protein AcetOrient_orf01949 [Acetobacter orientalis]